MHNSKLIIEIQMDFKKKIMTDIESTEPLTAESLKKSFESAKESSFDEV